MQQRGSNFRGGLHALLDPQRIDQAGVTAGYANRAAGQAEQIRDRVMNETDPAKRRALTDTMMAMEARPFRTWLCQAASRWMLPVAGPTAHHRLCSTDRRGSGCSSRVKRATFQRA